jgi:hypothetical protein
MSLNNPVLTAGSQPGLGSPNRIRIVELHRYEERPPTAEALKRGILVTNGQVEGNAILLSSASLEIVAGNFFIFLFEKLEKKN